MTVQRKILIVEDNALNREMLGSILTPAYQILEAENGQEALDVLGKHKSDISLILLDLVMPVMDGYTFLSKIKADAAYSLIPVVVTTQSDGEENEVAALSQGAADFISKPYRPEIILHRVTNIINLRETAAMVNQLKYDRLTSIYSKEYFYQCIKNRLTDAPKKEYTIVCSNIENFKLINDVFGTAAGDCLLKGIAELFKKFEEDGGIYGRINADHFACIVEQNQKYTSEWFSEVNNLLNDLSCVKNVTMKWGIYHIEDKTVTSEQMCDRALLAANSIKGQYGKIFAVYDDTMRGKLLREQAITDEMATALTNGQFEVYFQPKYCIEDNILIGAEALVRWNHPEWGIQSPATFIPLFEKNGFITKLDQFV